MERPGGPLTRARTPGRPAVVGAAVVGAAAVGALTVNGKLDRLTGRVDANITAITNAERQRRYRQRRDAGEPVRTIREAEGPTGRRRSGGPTPVDQLRTLQAEYQTWRDQLRRPAGRYHPYFPLVAGKQIAFRRRGTTSVPGWFRLARPASRVRSGGSAR